MIEVKNINKEYVNGDIRFKALNGVSFEIQKGEFVAIMGPSGSGKSTLMHILGALDTPSSGKYFLEGKDMSKMADDELADIRKDKIGFVFQSFNLLPRTTVLRNVMLPLIYEGIKHEERIIRAEESLIAAGMDRDHFHHLSNQLSGGQIQRVAIARALVNNPAIILADEPTGNLDHETAHDIQNLLLNAVQNSGKALVLVTHNLQLATLLDACYELEGGYLRNFRT